jgi:hypothetical protein
MRRTIIRISLASIVGALAFTGVGCTETRTSYQGYEDGTYHGFNDPANLHLNMNWTPYVSEYGANTGVTGSSASPYVGGGIINKKPDPARVPARTTTTTTTTYTTPGTTTYTSPAPADETTIIRRNY